jgi:hypothetical protein
MKTKKSKTWFVSIIIFILFGLLSCTKEKYPNKMDSIVKALSKNKKMRQCIYWVCRGFCLLLKDCKCNKSMKKIIDNCNSFKYTL